MDSDSLIYIIIAVVLAIVNAIAQKKKKTDKAKAATNAMIQGGSDEEAITEPEIIEKPDPLDFILRKEFLFEELADDEEAPTTSDTIQDVPVEIEEVISPEQEKLLNKAKELLLQAPESDDAFDYEEDSIASSSISDALTEEQEKQAFHLSLSDLQKDFDIRKAIIYSEIINPKYFSWHSYYNA